MKSDDTLRHDVETELLWDPSIDAHAVAASVEDGIVTLMGRVSHYPERSAAEWAAERVRGVRGVANEIDVERPGDHSDTEIASAAADALESDPHAKTCVIKPVVSDGCVTLDGEAEWNFQRLAAQKALSLIPGVRRVNNRIHLRSKATAENVKEKIEAAIQRLALLDAKDISVESSGSRVVLRGRVHALIARKEAETAAWAAPGVTDVENQIEVISR